MTDTTRIKFVALAQKRMNRAIKAIRAVGDLGGRKGVLSKNDAEKIKEALSIEVENTFDRLDAGLKDEPDFRLGPMIAVGEEIGE